MTHVLIKRNLIFKEVLGMHTEEGPLEDTVKRWSSAS